MKIAENPVTGRLPGDPRDERVGKAMDKLGLIERMLMTSDGTVTIMLEQIVGEPIATARLDQSVAPVDPDTAAVLPFPTTSLMTRTTQLVGATTGTVYVRATSVFCPGALPERVCAGLLKTGEPIGRLLRRHRVESFREILSIEVPDDPGPAEPSRRYVICIGGNPAVLIEEIFTADCFRSRAAGFAAY
jgi:chorismate-pyruvate lyase